MELTDKTKEQFEAWAVNNSFGLKSKDVGFKILIDSKFTYMHSVPDSMKFGVYVDYFDSVNIFIEVVSINETDFTLQLWNKKNIPLFNGEIYETRPEARIAAIEKANEIQNKKLKA